jgi:hypothetical protein
MSGIILTVGCEGIFKGSSQQVPQAGRTLLKFDATDGLAGAAINSPTKFLESGSSFLLRKAANFDFDQISSLFGVRFNILAAGPGVELQLSEHLDRKDSAQLKVSIPLWMPGKKGQELAVLFQLPGDSGYELGMIPNDRISREAGAATFRSMGQGNYQMVWVEPGLVQKDRKISENNLLSETAGIFSFPLTGLGLMKAQ